MSVHPFSVYVVSAAMENLAVLEKTAGLPRYLANARKLITAGVPERAAGMTGMQQLHDLVGKLPASEYGQARLTATMRGRESARLSREAATYNRPMLQSTSAIRSGTPFDVYHSEREYIGRGLRDRAAAMRTSGEINRAISRNELGFAERARQRQSTLSALTAKPYSSAGPAVQSARVSSLLAKQTGPKPNMLRSQL